MLNKKNLYIFQICILIALFVPVQVSADFLHRGASSTQDIAFAFYKLVGLAPDYDIWVEEYTKRRIREYGQLGKRDYKTNTRNKVVDDFKKFNVENDLLIINTAVILEALPIDPQNPDKRFLNIYQKKMPLFIGKKIPGYNLNIVVPELENDIDIVISKEEFERLNKLFRGGGGMYKKNSVSMRMYLKAIKADKDNPIEYNGNEFHMMLTKLDRFEIWDNLFGNRYWPLGPTEEEVEEQQAEEVKDSFFDKYK